MSPAESPILSPRPSLRGRASRLFRGLTQRRTPAAEHQLSDRRGPECDRSTGGDGRPIQAVTRRLIADDRYAFVLLNEAAENIDSADAQAAWQTLAEQMALVPGGVVPVVCADGSIESTELSAFYLDRFAVTNQQFRRFVQ